MTKEEIRAELYFKINTVDWHFFHWHFRVYHPRLNNEHPLATSIIDSCYVCEQKMPGYATRYIDKLCSISERENFIPHYDQLLQHLAELMVVAHLAKVFDDTWGFEDEPRIGDSNKNPEIKIEKDNFVVLVEVKSPSFTEYQKLRREAEIQIAGRFPEGLNLAAALSTNRGNAALPRDNNVKDFLISADGKFSAFKLNLPQSVTVLVIVWDDFIYEPITALINQNTGLLTAKSYYVDDNGNPISFDSTDYVIVMRNMTQVANSTKDIPVSDGLEHPLEYGYRGQTLSKALIENNQNDIGLEILDIFQCEKIEDLQHFAEYRPQEIILNINPD